MGMMSTEFFKSGILKAGVVALTLVLAGCGDNENNGSSAGLGDRDWGDFGKEGEIVLGDPDAPVSIIEYASVTCPHCASFHVYTYPLMKENYIDTGMVRYVMRAMPTPPIAMAQLGFMTASCVNDDRYYAFIDALMRRQAAWAYDPDPQVRRRNLGQLAGLAGLTQEEFETCIADQAALDRVVASTEEAMSVGVNSTPTFFVNGEQHTGSIDWASFEPMIIRHLPEDLRPAPEVEGDLDTSAGEEG